MRLAVISVHGCPVAQAGLQDTGGMNVYLLEMARHLSAIGIDVDIFTRRHRSDDSDIRRIASRSRIMHLRAGPITLPKAEIQNYLPQFQDELLAFTKRQSLNYDILYSNYWLSGLVGLELAQLWHVPHIVSFHTLAALKQSVIAQVQDPPERVAAEGRIAQSVDKVVTWTSHESDYLEQLYDLPPSKTITIAPGVNCDLFKPMPDQGTRSDYSRTVPVSEHLNGDNNGTRSPAPLVLDDNVLPNSPKLLFVGRIEPLKGVDILINILPFLETLDVRLQVIGGSADSKERRVLMARAQERNLLDRIEFLDAVPREELPKYFAQAALCVMPSYYESFGFVALEAAACGCPVVASNVPGLKKIVLDGKTGYLVSPKCPELFALKIDLLLSNRHLREAMGRLARERALKLSWNITATELALLFTELTGVATPGTSNGATLKGNRQASNRVTTVTPSIL